MGWAPRIVTIEGGRAPAIDQGAGAGIGSVETKQRFATAGVALGLMAFAHACTIRDTTTVPVGSVEVEPSSVTVLEGETQRFTARARDESGRDLPTDLVTWSTDAPSVLSIDSTGAGVALAPGQATVWATLLGTRGSGRVSVEPGPSIVVDGPSLAFTAAVGGSPPDPVTLEITNGGGGSVEGLSASVRYPQGAATGWLTPALAGTSAPTTLTVSGLLGLLPEGTHAASVVVASSDTRIRPVTLPVRAVVVLDKPIIGLSAETLEFRAQARGLPATAQTIQITNQGGGILSQLQATTLYTGVGGWLSAALTGTTAPAELRVQPDPSELSPGTYAAEIRVVGPGALNSPRTVEVALSVEAGAASPARSTATLTDGSAGAPTHVVVQARDESGYPLGSGGATVVVTVSGANAAGPVTATDRGDGTYAASYEPTAAGTDRIAVTMDSEPIDGSPFTSEVGPGPLSPESSTATVPSGSVGSATGITVRARDAFGNPLAVGGADVAVAVSGANNAGALSVTDRGNGTYTARYTPSSPGTDVVTVTVEGVPVDGSPFTSEVSPGGASAARSTATVPDGRVGSPTDIAVQARDASGAPLTSGGAEVAVTVSGANDPGPLTVTDLDDGTYAASYTPTSAGTDQVAITLNGSPIGGSPYTSTVSPGSASPGQSTATVPGGTAGLPTDIVVQARDASGEPFPYGGAKVLVTVSGANKAGSLTVTDRGDGTYTASYTPTAAGTDHITITMDGKAIGGSPYESAVVPGAASPEHSTAKVPDGKAGTRLTIEVQARDAYGNRLTVGGEEVKVTVSGTNTLGPVIAVDNGDGTYSLTYTPTLKGTDSVAITMNGTPIEGSPFTCKVG